MFHVRMLCEELTALHQCHGMRMDLGDGVPVVIWQATDTMGDMQLMLSHDGGAGFTQQLVVMQQRAGDGILDGEHADGGWVLLDGVKHLLEGRATNQLYLLILEEQMGGDVVKRTDESLYRYSLHNAFYFYKKTPLSLVCEAEPYLILQFFNSLILHTAFRFTEPCKVKVITVKVSVSIQHCSVVFVLLGAKVKQFP